MPMMGRKPVGTMAYMGGVAAVLEEFCWAWGQMVAFTMQHACDPVMEYVHLEKATISFHSWARNDLASKFLGDWLYMQDTDHIPEPDTVVRLLHRMNEYDLDVVSGVYQFKRPPHPPVVFGWQKKDNGERYFNNSTVIGRWDESVPLQSVAATGGGSLLVRRRVFERIRDELKEGPFDVIGQGGEDMGFFKRLDRLGIKPFVDFRVECPHADVRRITLKDYKIPAGLDGPALEFADGKVPD